MSETTTGAVSGLHAMCHEYSQGLLNRIDALEDVLEAERARADAAEVRCAELEAAIRAYLDAQRGTYGNVCHATADIEVTFRDLLARTAPEEPER